jgi:ESCRT-I complex subunit TSG101
MPSPTLLWLRTHSAPYPHSDRVYDHVAAALAAYPTLRPKADVYAHDDGRTHLLICLHGILPIVFRNAPYNIPIALWLVRDYPRQPPIPYVVPTTGILVKPGRFVDLSGRCSLDYIQHWQRKSEVPLHLLSSHPFTPHHSSHHQGCNLLALIQSMQDLFSRDPPLYAKPPPPALHSSVQSPPTTPSVSSVISPTYLA